MKRTLTSLIPLGLVFSATTYAAAPMLPEEIPVIDEQDRFVIGVEGHFFRQHQNMLNYGVTTDAVGNYKEHYLDPDFDLAGGRIFASYMFTNENDIQLSWSHVSHDDSDKIVTADYNGASVSGVFSDLVDFAALPGDTFALSKDSDLDIVDLDMGRVFHDENYMVRIFAGARYVTLDDELRLKVTNGAVITDGKAESELNGIGPRAGFDARYRIMDHVSVTGHMGAALLKSYVDSKSDQYDFVAASVVRVKTEEIERLVPNLDARVGVAVDFMFDDGWGLVVEGGMHAEHFFNGATQANAFGSLNRDVSFYGPYLALAVMFS